MIFNAATQADLIARIQAIDPTPDVNPLQAQLDDAMAQISALNEQVAGMQAKIASAAATLATVVATLRA